MASDSKVAATIEQYIRMAEPRVRPVLKRIRRIVRAAAPGATEVISYRMPAFKLHGIVVYFAAFENHIGLYPPVAGDPTLVKAAAPYAGEKGNLRFPLDEPIPYDLIERVVLHRSRQNLAKRSAAANRRKGAPAGKRSARPRR